MKCCLSSPVLYREFRNEYRARGANAWQSCSDESIKPIWVKHSYKTFEALLLGI